LVHAHSKNLPSVPEPAFSVGVLFVLSDATPSKNLSQGPSFGGCGFIYAYLGKNNAWC
jgi:hypothetical protein